MKLLLVILAWENHILKVISFSGWRSQLQRVTWFDFASLSTAEDIGVEKVLKGHS